MNEVIEKTKAAILERADPRLREPIAKVVEAGQQVMYSPKTRKMAIEQMKQGQDPEAIGAGIAKLLAILFNQSGKKMPMEVAIPAAMLLMCEALAFLEEAGSVQVDQQFLAACASATGSAILQMFGATPEQMQAFIDKGAPQAAPQPAGIVAGAGV